MQISQVNPFNYPIIYYTMKDKSWVLAKWPDYDFDVIFQILREVWRVINILFSFFKLSLLTHWTKVSPLFTYVPSFSSFWLFFFFGLDTCSHYFQHNIEFCLYCSDWFQKQRGYQNKFSNFTYKITNDEVFPLGSNLTFTYCFKLNRIWTASLIPLLKESWNSYCAVKIKFKVLSTLTLKLRYANLFPSSHKICFLLK